MEVLGFYKQDGVPRVLDRENLEEERGKPTIIKTQATNQDKPLHRHNETPDMISYVDVANIADSGLSLVINNNDLNKRETHDYM